MMRSDLCQPLGDFLARHAVNPLEIGRDGAGLVTLYRADEMPFEREVAQFRDFFHGFQGIVLPECPLTGGVRLFYVLGGKGLTHRDQRNVVGPPAGGLRGTLDTGTDGLQVDGDYGHNFRIAPGQ